ncbi:MAG TPA: glycosyltransferase, partial [Thermoleophilaceae bacterium]|nr:glycosyltransferase [Thermoleophilaceae bacterium]
AALAGQSVPYFEIVVVDDGSAEKAAVVAAVGTEPRARLVRTGGRGPAAARNAGAREALGAILCFTDDDCEPSATWIAALVAAIEHGAAAAAGPTLNARPESSWATASQAIVDHVTEATLERATGRVGFVPSCNLACRAEVLSAVPFDERFPLAAGEDRDWCARLAERGLSISFTAGARVEHRPRLTLGGFWRQQVRYGRGAWRFRRAAAGRPGLAPPRYYARLLGRGFARGPRAGALVCLAQLAVALGLVAEAVGDLRTRRPTAHVAGRSTTGRDERP